MNVQIGTWLVHGIVVNVKVLDHIAHPLGPGTYRITPIAGMGELWVPAHEITTLKPCIREVPSHDLRPIVEAVRELQATIDSLGKTLDDNRTVA